jgi:enoyl-CoA hydratase/carnithine racemase
MTQTLVHYAKEADGLAVITLDAPPANTYSYEMMRQLDSAVLEARMDDAVHVLVLRGAGEKFFCAGSDIRLLASASPVTSITSACTPTRPSTGSSRRRSWSSPR